MSTENHELLSPSTAAASASILWEWTMPNGEKRFPGGSRARVNRAGDAVRCGVETHDDVLVINSWRAAHSSVINSFQSLLRGRTRGRNIAVAQRHKRRRTIVDKLKRYPHMQLGRMDDVAGCRLIFEETEQLDAFRNSLHKARFKHILKNDTEKYNYIVNPKASGYRGIHDIYSYNVNSAKNKHLTGLLIELQYRTRHQHAWATASELIGLLTENEPKFDRGEVAYRRVMRLASEIIARAFEKMDSSLPELSGKEVVEEFTSLDRSLKMMEMFGALRIPNIVVRGPRNAIFMFEANELKVFEYESTKAAWRALLDLEKEDLRAACKTLIDSERRKNTQASSDVGARQLARF